MEDALREACTSDGIQTVLDATKEVISEQLGLSAGVEPTPVQYFSAIVATLLEDQDDDVSASTLTLLSVILQFTPQSLLQSHFYQIAESVGGDLINKGADNDEIAIPALTCLGHLLKHQSKSTWTRPQTVLIYNQILAFTLDPRMDVCKAAQSAVVEIFTFRPSPSPSHFPARAGEVLVNFWRRMLLDEPGMRVQEQERNGSLIVMLSKLLIDDLSTDLADAICELALSAAGAPIPAIHRVAWLLLDSVTSNTDSKPSITTVAKSIAALIDNRPVLQDRAQAIVHAQVLKGCLLKLHSLDPRLCSSVLKPAVESMVKFFASGDENVIEIVADSLYELCDDVFVTQVNVREAVHWAEISQGTQQHTHTHQNEAVPALVSVLNAICVRGLQLKHRMAWPAILEIVEHLIDCLEIESGSESSIDIALLIIPVIQLCFPMLHELKSSTHADPDKDDAFSFQLQTALEKTVGRCMQVIGPHRFHSSIVVGEESLLSLWEAIKRDPIKFCDSMLVSLLVTLIQHHGSRTQLSFFVQYVFPTATAARHQAIHLKEQESPFYQAVNHLSFRLFGLISSFVDNPKDLSVTFRQLAPQLGAILDGTTPSSVQPDDWIPVVCNALKVLVDSQLQLEDQGEGDGEEEGEEEDEEGEGDGDGENDAVKQKLHKRFKEEADIDADIDDNDSDVDMGGKEKDPKRRSKSKSKTVSQSKKQKQNIDCLASFAKNYLPLLQKIAVNASLPEKYRLVALQTISSYAKITAPDMLRKFFLMSMGSMIRVTTEIAAVDGDGDGMSVNVDQINELLFKRTTMADLLNVLLPVLKTDSETKAETGSKGKIYATLWKTLKPQFSDADGSFQKRSYRIFETLCTYHEEWVASHIQESTDILDTLISCVDTCHVAARRSRLRALVALLPYIPSDQIQPMIKQILPEVLLCIKEPNRSLRQSAMDSLKEMADSWVGNRTGSKARAGYGVFMQQVAAGLAGRTPQMISATIGALAWLLFVLGSDGKLNDDISDDLIGTIVFFFGQDNTPIVRGVLSFIKICTNPRVVPTAVLQSNLPKLVPGLLHWSERSPDTKTRVSYRLQIRVILERILRRFDYESLLWLFPESDKKFLANIHKEMQRKARRKAEKREAERRGRAVDPMMVDGDGEAADHDGDDDGDVAFSRPGAGGSGGSGTKMTMIRDAGNVDIDLMDPSSARHMVSADAAARAMRKRGRGGEVDSDEEFGDAVKERDDGRVELIEAPTDSEASDNSDDDDDDDDEMDIDFLQGADDTAATTTDRPRNRVKRMRVNADGEGGADAVGSGPKPRTTFGGRGKRWWAKDSDEALTRAKATSTGQEFRAKRAEGDVSRTGVQPYAYIPLGRVGGGRNKKSGAIVRGKGGRKAKRMAAELDAVVGGAKRGAKKGYKHRSKK